MFSGLHLQPVLVFSTFVLKGILKVIVFQNNNFEKLSEDLKMFFNTLMKIFHRKSDRFQLSAKSTHPARNIASYYVTGGRCMLAAATAQYRE